MPSSRSGNLSDQRATMRKPVHRPKEPVESTSKRPEAKVNIEQMSSQTEEQGAVEEKGTVEQEDAVEHKVAAEQKGAVEKKVTLRRSIRNLFQKRDTEDKPPPMPTVPKSLYKRSAIIGNSFTSRFTKSSRKTSEMTDQRLESARAEQVPNRAAHVKPKATKMSSPASDVAARENIDLQGVISSGSAASKTEPATTSDTAAVVNSLLEKVAELPASSPDRLRGLEIAEVCSILHARANMLDELVLTSRSKQALINTVIACKEAKGAAIKAEASAREAALSAEKAGLTLDRMEKLCEKGFNTEATQTIKDLISGARGA